MNTELSRLPERSGCLTSRRSLVRTQHRPVGQGLPPARELNGQSQAVGRTTGDARDTEVGLPPTAARVSCVHGAGVLVKFWVGLAIGVMTVHC